MYINSSFFRNSRSVVFSVLVYFYFCFCSVHNWASSNALATNTNGDTEYDCAFVWTLVEKENRSGLFINRLLPGKPLQNVVKCIGTWLIPS